MSRIAQSKRTYTIEQSIDHFLKLIVVKRVINNKCILQLHYDELSKFFISYPYHLCYDQIFMNVAYFVLYDLTDYYARLNKLRQVKKNSREWFYIQMGDEGINIYIDKYIRNPNLQSKEAGGRSSKSALKFFRYLDSILLQKEIHTKSLYMDVDVNKHEFRIRSDEPRWYCYDYTIKEFNIIVEYHGEHVHPKKEQIGTNWRHIYTKENAETVYSRDEKKRKVAEYNGFKYYVVWHSDSIDTKNEVIKKILENLPDKVPIDTSLVNCVQEKIVIYGRRYIVTTPAGVEEIYKGYKSITQKYDFLTTWQIEQMLNGNKAEFKGFKLKRAEQYD